MNAYIDERADGSFAFFMDGDLQFDSTDEAVYHEGLALPPLCMARAASPDTDLRVLICGGGDGLALRETLRFPGVCHVDLVDISAEVIALGRTRFAEQNDGAFSDPRVRAIVGDAFTFLDDCPDAAYDVVLCDFTVPRSREEADVFTREWYLRVARVLGPRGVVGINGVSPQLRPAAFDCIQATVRAAGLCPLPFRVCIPSFREYGYGAWGFILAARDAPTAGDLAAVCACPVSTRALDLTRLMEVGIFETATGAPLPSSPIHTRNEDRLLPLLLNPGQTGVRAETAPPSLDGLFQAIPILHPYHTREMIESLAKQVTGSVRAIDLRRLLDALLKTGAEIAGDLRRELTRLRQYLDKAVAPRFEQFEAWSQRLFVALALLMTLANVVAPDNAFGKGAEGIGHASVSVGYGNGGFGHASEGGSFGGGRASGYVESAPISGGSFGGSRSSSKVGSSPKVGGSFGGFRTTSHAPDAPLTGHGFRDAYGRGEPTDIFGNSYKSHIFRYYSNGSSGSSYGHSGAGYGYGGRGGGAGAPPPVEQNARFVADDDMFVLDNGDVVITLSDTAYVLVSNGQASLMNQADPHAVFELYPDPRLFANIEARLSDQNIATQKEIALRRDWLSWVSWTAALFPVIRDDEKELRSLEDLSRRLRTANGRLGVPASDLPPDLPRNLALNATELCVDAGILADGRVALIDRAGVYWFTNGSSLISGKTGVSTACPPLLKSALSSVLTKRAAEMLAEMGEQAREVTQLALDRRSLESDLAEYSRLQAQNGPDYDVDYGTDEISAQSAVQRTTSDLQQNQADSAAAQTRQGVLATQREGVQSTLSRFGK